jgi:hypothetical protein
VLSPKLKLESPRKEGTGDCGEGGRKVRRKEGRKEGRKEIVS